MKALIFDCDGVLVDTERDGHRVAFNRAFEAAGIDAEWDVDLYGEIAEVRFAHFLRSERKFDGVDALIAQLTHDVDHARQLLAP